eukprot:2403112-Amphidinium_carterae.1
MEADCPGLHKFTCHDWSSGSQTCLLINPGYPWAEIDALRISSQWERSACFCRSVCTGVSGQSSQDVERFELDCA